MEKKKLIIFDFDGVIIDSWEHAYVGNLRSWPDLTTEQHRNFFNGNIHEELEKMPDPLYSREEQESWWNEVHAPKKSELQIFEGIKEVIEELEKEFVLSINTSADSISTKNYLKENNIDFFDTVYGNEISKSKVEKFNKILDYYNVEANDCFFITDTVGDVKEANTLAIPTILVTYGYHNEKHFDSVIDKVIGMASSPRDILRFINNI